MKEESKELVNNIMSKCHFFRELDGYCAMYHKVSEFASHYVGDNWRKYIKLEIRVVLKDGYVPDFVDSIIDFLDVNKFVTHKLTEAITELGWRNAGLSVSRDRQTLVFLITWPETATCFVFDEPERADMHSIQCLSCPD